MHSKIATRFHTRGRRISCELFQTQTRIDGRRLSCTFGHRFAPTLGARDSSFLRFRNKVFTFARTPATIARKLGSCLRAPRVFSNPSRLRAALYPSFSPSSRFMPGPAKELVQSFASAFYFPSLSTRRKNFQSIERKEKKVTRRAA